MKSYFSRRNFFAVLVALMVMCITAGVANCGTYNGGTGEPNNPYLISTAEDLNDIGNHPEDFNKHFIMVNDINLADYTGTQFNIIGDSFSGSFSGVFDGNGFTILNFNWSISLSYDQWIGIFGFVRPEGEVRNVILESVDINALPYSDNVGALVGYNDGGSILHCSASGRIYGSGFLGGLVGYNNYGTVLSCYSTVSVSGDSDSVGGLIGFDVGGTITNCAAESVVSGNCWSAGGLVGRAYASNISKCYSISDVNVTTGNYAGGLIGYATVDPILIDCYSNGVVFGNKGIGGLVGYISGSESPIVKCYSAAEVGGNEDVGALIGKLSTSSAGCTNSFWDVMVNSDANGIGNGSDPNVIGLTTAQMQQRSTFVDAGWDFNTPIWKMCDGPDYPKLGWEECPEAATLLDVVSTMLDANSLKNENMKNALLNKIDAALAMIDERLNEEALTKMASVGSVKANRSYNGALNKLENDILAKMDGCAETGEPDKNDWIITCEGQSQVYPLIMETIEYVRSLME